MSFKKKVLAVAAVGALTAATAVPAMALENEFHGMYRLRAMVSNVDDGAPGFITLGNDGYKGNFTTQGLTGGVSNNAIDRYQVNKNFIEQRARLMYIAKANDDLKLVTQFELDARWGDNSYNVGRNSGGALGADQVNIETKNVYLDFNIPSTTINMKTGIQTWTDAYGGIIVNNDMAGALATAKFDKLTTQLGFFRWDDRGNASVGKQSRDFVAADAKYNITKDIRVGASYYLLNDDTGIANGSVSGNGATDTDPYRNFNKEIVHTFGVNTDAKFGPVTLNAAALYQFGNLENLGATGIDVNNNNDTHLSAFAFLAGAKVKAGPGTAKTSFLYTSGEKNAMRGESNAFQSANNMTSSGHSENTFYQADMMLLLRNKYELTDSRAMAYTMNNKDQGIVGGFIGYDAEITSKLYANANLGFMATAKDNANKPYVLASNNKPVVDSGSPDGFKRNNSNYLGTEVNAEVGYKLYDNMTASLQGAYVFLGDYYNNTAKGGLDPQNPYTTRIMLNYAF